MKMLNQSVDCLQKYSLFMGDTICFTGWLLLPRNTYCSTQAAESMGNPFLGVSVKGRRKAERWDQDEIRMRWGMSVCSISVAVQNFTWTLFHMIFLIDSLASMFFFHISMLKGVCHWFHSLGNIPITSQSYLDSIPIRVPMVGLKDII